MVDVVITLFQKIYTNIFIGQKVKTQIEIFFTCKYKKSFQTLLSLPFCPRGDSRVDPQPTLTKL